MIGKNAMVANRVALVTGAGAGTGREYTKLLLNDGARVIAVSLLADELDSLQTDLDPHGGRLTIKQADLSLPHAAEDLVKWCDERGFDIDVLINNAGFAIYGEPTQVDLDRVETMIGLNVVTTLKLSVLFGRRMKARG
ncbi:MAG: SDR family NAD(P)-dependent oxidoreductase, partial [Mycobacterium sp.]